MDTVELIGAGCSLLYLVLEIRQRKALWVVGFVSSAFYVYIFFQAKFYADMGLNIYYLLASVYGWLLWSRRPARADRPAPAIVRLRPAPALALLGVAGALYAALALVLKHYTDSPVPLGDALTTALSVVATWMLAHRIIEQWWVWLFVNALSAALYFSRGLYPTAILFCCYAVASVAGYYSWNRNLRRSNVS